LSVKEQQSDNLSADNDYEQGPTYLQLSAPFNATYGNRSHICNRQLFEWTNQPALQGDQSWHASLPIALLHRKLKIRRAVFS
jgi:hypothetical protein